MTNQPEHPDQDDIESRSLPLVVYCSGNAWTNPVGTDRQIASRLAKSARVLFVDPPVPLRPRNVASFRAPTFQRIDERLWRLIPKSPPGVTRPGVRTLAATLAQRSIRRTVAQLGGDVHAIVVSSLDPYLSVCTTPRRVFYGTDDFRAGARLMGLSPSWVERREVEQLESATAIVSVSEPLAERWRDLGYDVAVIPNGCDTAEFARTDTVEPASDIMLEQPIAGVIGQLNNRLDFDMLEAVADRGVSLLLVGPISEPVDRTRLQVLADRSNVQLVGRRPFEDIPSYLRAVKVGLTPYTDTPFNRGSSPLKTLEYLAAGRAAVVSDLPAARSLQTDLISIADHPEEFARLVVEQLESADSEELRARRRAFAATHSWDRRIEDFLQVLGLMPSP